MIPKKLLPTAWQLAQPDAMPACVIVPPAKLVNLVGEWQSSQACDVGMCVGGGETGTMPVKLRPLAWQAAQPLLMPAWFIVPPAYVPGVAWQVAQGWAVGMWLAGCVETPERNDVVDAWQLPHSPETG